LTTTANESGKAIDYMITEVNPAYEKITGLKREEIIAKTATDLFPKIKNSTVDWIEIFGEVALTRKTLSIEVYSDITNRWYNALYYCPVPGYAASIFSDITDRKNNEEELKKIKQRLEEAQKFAHLGYWEFDVISGENSWSDELFRICGFQPQEFVPTINDFTKLIHPEDKELVFNLLEKRLNSNEFELDFRIIAQDHEKKWIHEKTKYEYNASGKVIRMYGVVQDITERKLSEIELKESEEKFKEIAENLGEVIWVRQDGQFVYISPAFEKVWGSTCQSLYDNPNLFIDSIHPNDKKTIMQTYLLETNISSSLFEEQYRIIRPDGTIRWIWSRKYPIYDNQGNMLRIVGISEDITKLKEYEESLNLAREEAETANKAKSQFLSNMSHEIRTPMSGIVGFIELLSRMPLEREQASYLAEVKTSTDTLLAMINDILDYSKIEAGRLLIENIPFNLHSLIEEAVSLFAPNAHRKSIEIFIYIATGVPREVQGDPGRLRQVLNNIIGNAVKFTDKGEVTVIVRMLNESKEKVLLQFEIQDTGIGISVETQGKLFQVFMQADASTTRKYEGTGLGLAISKKILEHLGGNIEVVSDLGLGSTFTITLEIEKVPLENEETKISSNKPNDLSNLRVMIVEDHEINRMLIREYLQEIGCKVISAPDGLKGLEILKGLASESLPQIVLVSYKTSGMSSPEFGIQLAKDERLKDIRLILITSAAQIRDARSAKNFGFSGYLSKPIRKAELIRVISDVDGLEAPNTTEIIAARYSSIADERPMPNIRILLVEDMLANQKLEMIMLAKIGYSVELAVNGKQAVEICNTKKYNLIFMDCQMPVMDGYEATLQIRKASILNKNTTVIAMTAHALEGDREKCIAAGMDDYISKPVTMKILEDTLRKYL